jgi:beta-N-acetylhexosaminidase
MASPLRPPLDLAGGQTLFIGIDGVRLTPATRDLLDRLRPGGIILFKRNVETLEGLAALCGELRNILDPPPLLAMDEEGGRVTRLAPHVAGLPPACATAALDPAELKGYWRRYGDLLAALGLDLDFAPVADLCPPDAPNGIADRSYGTDPGRVIACSGAAMEGLIEAGILPTLKHFPGLGGTLLDSHHHLPTVQKGREPFEREDLAPFAALAARAPAVMIGHGHYPFYSGPDPAAATLSRAIATDLLRGRIGFTGTAISDDLEMKAVAARVPWDQLAPRAIEAGGDMVLICHRADRAEAAFAAIRRRAAADAAFAGRVREAAARVEGLRRAAGAARAAAGAGAGARGPDRIEEARARLVETAAAVPAARA